MHETENEFTVKESRSVNYMIAILLIVVFLVASIMIKVSWGSFLMAIFLFLFPAGMSLARGRKNTTVIRINRSGFYYHEELLTNWNNFVSATVDHDEENVGRINDNFVLMLKYYSTDNTRLFRSKIRLTNTQDKSEEEIIEAIDHYYKTARQHAGNAQLPLS